MSRSTASKAIPTPSSVYNSAPSHNRRASVTFEIPEMSTVGSLNAGTAGDEAAFFSTGFSRKASASKSASVARSLEFTTPRKPEPRSAAVTPTVSAGQHPGVSAALRHQLQELEVKQREFDRQRVAQPIDLPVPIPLPGPAPSLARTSSAPMMTPGQTKQPLASVANTPVVATSVSPTGSVPGGTTPVPFALHTPASATARPEDSPAMATVIQQLVAEKTRAEDEAKQLRGRSALWDQEKEILKNQMMGYMREVAKLLDEQDVFKKELSEWRTKQAADDKARADQEQQAEFYREELDQALTAKVVIERQLTQLVATYGDLMSESSAMRARLTELQSDRSSVTERIESSKREAAAAIRAREETEARMSKMQDEMMRMRDQSALVAEENLALRSGQYVDKIKEDLDALVAEKILNQQEMQKLRLEQEEATIHRTELERYVDHIHTQKRQAQFEVQVLKEQLKTHLQDLARMNLLVDQHDHSATPLGVVTGLLKGTPHRLESMRSIEEKRTLLKLAVETVDENVMLHVVVFLKDTLQPELFMNVMSQYDAAQRVYINYLKTFDRTEELRQIYALLNMHHEEALLRLKECMNVSEPSARLVMLHYHLPFFQRTPQMQEMLEDVVLPLIDSINEQLADTSSQTEPQHRWGDEDRMFAVSPPGDDMFM
eukprot:TRINITY_DN10719_c0_g1_i1.p1 TRINITY_DN10719_c0_g1~~TRINITY_DN10719_c0_g1_i1.p1  ORF type:complete len:662 (+),score=162.35 TRINITY_DN10719_c0_g1_i1:129-2114(+)